MKKAFIIIAVILVVGGAAGAGYYFWSQQNDEQEDSQATTQESTDTNGFNALSTEGEAFVATITTKQGGEVNEATISFDGQGKSEYVATTNGQTIRTVYTEDAFYTCNDAQGCFKFSLSDSSGTNVDPATYQFSSSDSEDYAATATKEDQKSCSTGMCDVWVSNSYKNQGKTTIYIDSATQRIVKVESTYDGVESTISYEYKDVKIQTPKNAEELPAGI